MSEYLSIVLIIVVGMVGIVFLLNYFFQKIYWVKYLPATLLCIFALFSYLKAKFDSEPMQDLGFLIMAILAGYGVVTGLVASFLIDAIRLYKKKIPNVITTIRLLLAIIFPFIFVQNMKWGLTIYVVASITDFLDGFLARKWNVISKYGKTIDPIADKMLGMLSLIFTSIYISKWLIIPLLLEVVIAMIGIHRFSMDSTFSVKYIGKVKTVLLLVTISLFMFTRVYTLSRILPTILLIVTVITQIIALIKYAVEKEIKDENII